MRINRRFAGLVWAAVVTAGLLAGVVPAFAWTPPAVSAGREHTVGLKADGSVVATGAHFFGQCNVTGWTGITAVSAGGSHTVGLKADGSVVATGANTEGQCNVSGWRGIVAVSAGGYHTVGLKADGSVVATGANWMGQSEVSGWTNIATITAGSVQTVGVRADGKAMQTPNPADVASWSGITAVAAGSEHTVGLKTDGTLVGVGANGIGQLNIAGWTDVCAVDAGDYHTVGLRADGTVVASGNNVSRQCNVSGWQLGPVARPVYRITPSAGPHGSISPSSTRSVPDGAYVTFKITPDPGYHVASVLADGVSIGAVGFYTFTKVTSSHTIHATFAVTPVTRSTTTRLTGPSTVGVRKTLKLTGTVSPATATGKVSIAKARRVGTKWRSAGSVKVSVVAGKYRYSFRPTRRGTWRFIATYTGGKVGATTYKASKSKARYTKVR